MIIFELTAAAGCVEQRELSLPGPVLSGAWPGSLMCLAFKRQYILMDEESGDLHELFDNAEKYGAKRGAEACCLIGADM